MSGAVVVTVSSDVVRSSRVLQLEGIFDVPPTRRVDLSWSVDLPIDARPWNIGLIVGPSGSGKTTVARALWPVQSGREFEWPEDRSIVDAFPSGMSIKDITGLLSSVGFSSPPSWVRPYRVLSTGEQFRVTMARVLAETSDDIAVVDEYTSVVDRTVAKIGSAAIAKTIRRRGQRFVAVTCHEDVIDWLQPDWVYRPSPAEFDWRSLQRRPAISLEIVRVHHSAWRHFAQHHYLSASLNVSSSCFVALYEDRPVAFSSWLTFPHPRMKNGKREHRTVCLPDYQGVGIGNALSETIASAYRALGYRPISTTTHPAMIRNRASSTVWRMTNQPGRNAASSGVLRGTTATDRATASFEYVGERMERSQAEALLSMHCDISSSAARHLVALTSSQSILDG